MARGDDLHAIKYLPLKLKGPARHWLNSLPANSIGSWENLEDAFLDNFQGTYVRPPDADDLSHITQQPGESARKFWTRFLTKKNQIVDCPDAEALAAFKHNIRDEWLARHLGQEKPKSMVALTTLMTRFCAGEDSWLARSSTTPHSGTSDVRDNNGKPRRNRHKRQNNGIVLLRANQLSSPAQKRVISVVRAAMDLGFSWPRCLASHSSWILCLKAARASASGQSTIWFFLVRNRVENFLADSPGC